VPGPDAIVKQHGETVTHEYVTDYEVDANGQVDESTVVTETRTIPAVVSQPSEEDTHRLEGRLSTGSLKLTVESDRDVRADRGGRRDRVMVDGTVYKVVEVRDDEHPVTGTRKQTVLVERLDGHT